MSSQSDEPDPAKPKVKTKLRGPMAALVEEFHESISANVQEAVTSGMAALGGMGTLIHAAVRHIADVDTIKALADPTRLAILRALMDGQPRGSRAMSAKELAEELGEPQTKLYRHLKVLEAQGLIVVAETRVVSGIVETRYRAGQSEFKFSPDASGDEMVDLVAAAMDEYRNAFVASARVGRVTFGPSAPEGHNRGLVMVSSSRLPVDRADELRARLQALVDEFAAVPEAADGVPVEMLIGWYSPRED